MPYERIPGPLLMRGYRPHALAICSCGRQSWVRLLRVDGPIAKPAGCPDCAKHRTHGMYREKGVWRCMLQRTSRLGTAYASRGISVCVGFQSFDNFARIMGKRPAQGLTLDRVDNDGGYWCGECDECRAAGRTLNCRWATRGVQNRNTIRTKLIEVNGERLVVKDWAAKMGIPWNAIRNRLRRGWSPERAVLTPLRES